MLVFGEEWVLQTIVFRAIVEKAWWLSALQDHPQDLLLSHAMSTDADGSVDVR